LRERTLARLAVACAALLFVVEGSCFLDRPGPNAGELAWGPLKLAIYQLVFAVRPQQVWNLRWPMLIVGAATVAVGCFLVRRMAGPWGLAAAAVLLATDPALIVSSRLDSADLTLPRFFLLLSLILFLRFWKTASRWYLAAAFSAVGLACANPAAIPVAVAIAAAALIAFRPEIRAVLGWRNLWPSGVGLMAGLIPLFFSRRVANVRTSPPDPLRVLDGSAWFGYAVRQQPGTWGIGARNWAQERTIAFAHAFGSPRHDMLAVGLLASFIAAGLFLSRSRSGDRPLRFSLSVLVCSYLAVAVTRPPAWSLVTPFAGIAIAVALSAVAKRSVYGAAAAAAAIAAFGFSSLAVTATFYSSALLYGGMAAWTEAAYNLADDLDVRDARDLCVLDPGTGAVLQLLRQGRQHLISLPGGEDTLYVASTDEESIRRANDLANAAHRRIQPVRFIQDFQGRSVFVLYRME
jgi:hypothetical protein